MPKSNSILHNIREVERQFRKQEEYRKLGMPEKSSANRDRLLNYHLTCPQKKNDQKMLLREENWQYPGNRLEESRVTYKYLSLIHI